ncbi:MAG: ABC transporter permease [Clostridia bacterium]|nr:ABC transporter permease [Clostridia bacterium]
MVKKMLGKSYLLLVLAFMYAPIVLIIILSFFSSGSRFSLAGTFTFDNYLAIFTSRSSPVLFDAIKNTLIIALVSSIIATVMGSVAAIGMFHLGKRGQRFVAGMNQLPIINSEIVMAVSLMIFFVTFSFPSGYTRLIIGHITFCTPYVVLSVLPRLYQMDPNVYEAALDLGANPTKALLKVQVPMLIPSILTGFIMSFTISLDDFIITQINKGASSGINTISTYLYEDTKSQGFQAFWPAIFSIIFIVVLTTLIMVNFKKKTNGGNAK